MTGEIDAYHFTGNRCQWTGRPIPPAGEWLRHDGEIVIRDSGLHASERLIDALSYAPGNMLHRVKVRGEIQREEDLICGRERMIVWTIDAEPIFRAIARRCALDVAHLWDMPAIVRKYLETGGEDIREAARVAAWDAARAAAGDAEWAAAEAAARAAAWGAARVSVWDAVMAAALDAVGDAELGAARAAVMTKYNNWLTEMVEAAR